MLDIVSVGSLAFGPFAGSTNPNVIFKNSQCRAKFKYDLDALEPTGTTRNYQGLAIGDFNRDGYPDVVSACGQVSKKKYLSRLPNYESVLDKTAFFTEIMDRVDNNSKWRWNGKTLGQGDMMVQINSETDKSKCWVSVQPVGMKGVVEGGKINRGALGSTIIVKPDGLRAVMAPVIGGESFGSQHSARKNFGLGKTCSGTVDILWPQGVRNRLYGVKHGEVLTFPEIPCSFSGKWNSENDYERCVVNALDAMLEKKIISKTLHHRLHIGAMTARKLTL